MTKGSDLVGRFGWTAKKTENCYKLEEQTAALSLVKRNCLTLDTGLMCSLVHFETGMGAEAIDMKALHKDAGDLKFTPHICK